MPYSNQLNDVGLDRQPKCRFAGAMKYHFSVAITLISLGAFATPTETRGILAAMAEQLNQARSPHVAQKRSFQCPDGLNRLIGVQYSAVSAALPAPDFAEEKPQRKWSYLLAVPAAARAEGAGATALTKGGGFPIITLTFSAQGAIEAVSCLSAR
ncbi:MAG: hypothetical protein M0Q15_09255 [Nevskia sp.]|jgi:hypothetical protein|nr:hypothetical protein [Nevskia sp.]